ncbi:MAG: efflux RND transporter permease subunit [Thermodesulfobacteriota bacterium]|nr:efflux RND transporter permease subunit [Thermodesulfobacteriota bacterium]
MKLPEFGVKKPVTTMMIFIAMVVLGFVALPMLGLDLMPDIEIPSVSVITTYKGAGPQEVETRITEPVEEMVSTVPKLDELKSVSLEGLSVVTAKFKWGVDLEEATSDVRDKVDIVKKKLPDAADDPILFKFDLAMFPVVIIGVSATESWEKLEHIVDKDICDPLKRIPGVATATYRGGMKRQINVELDRTRLEAYGLTPTHVINALALQNLSNPGGHLKSGHMDYLVRTPEEFSSPDEISQVVIAYHNGTPVHVSDLARVYDGFAEKTHDVLINGKKGMIVMVQKQSGENTVMAAKRVRAALKDIKKNLPPDVKMKIVIDSSDFIQKSINNLRDTIIWACIFVFLVVIFFLRNLKASLIVAASIPTSLVITFLLMYFMGYTINQITLSSLAIAVGMVVNNAIIVLDNIHRHRERGQKANEGAIFGANEMGTPVIASTLTTMAIFVPIVFIGGITSIMFTALAVVVSISLLASLITSLMLVPMLCSKFLDVAEEHTSKTFIASEKIFTSLEDGYSRWLGSALSNRKTVVVGAGLLLVLTFAVVPLVGSEFMPEQDQSRISANVELPIGTRFEKTGEACERINQILEKDVPELYTYYDRWGVGEMGIGTILGYEEASNTGNITARLVHKDERNASPKQIIERIRPMVERIPGAEVRFSVEDPLGGIMFGGGKSLSIDLYGHDLDDSMNYAGAVKTALLNIEGVKDVEISRKQTKPELQVIIDREKASALGLNVTDIAKTVEIFFSGNTDVKYREGGDEYDIEVRLRPEDRIKVEDLRDVFINTSSGRKIPLSNIAYIKMGRGPTKIERNDQERIVTVSGDIYGRDLGSVVADANEALERLPKPPGFSYKFSGAQKEKVEAFRLLIMAAILGMILVYMVMASQFESLRDPFIIFLSIPFGLIGVIWILAITGQRVSVMSFIGLIMLIGIVVNNGIVLISYIGILRQRGKSVRDAVMEGGRARLRPVLATTLTTILAMTPLALSRGEGSEAWVPMALTVIGGLAVSTVVTLIFMPTLYSIFEDWQNIMSQFNGKERP